MTGSLAIFYVAAGVTLVGAAGAVSRRTPAEALRWFAVALAGAATVAILVQAPLVALVLVVASGWGLALLALGADKDGPAGALATAEGATGRRGSTIAAAVALGLLAWVFLGTWGRQQAFPGHDLAPGASFGGVRELASAAAGELMSLWIAAPLLILAAVLVGVAVVDAPEEG